MFAKGARAHDCHDEPLPHLAACGDMTAHARTKRPRRHTETVTLTLHRAVAWIVSLANGEGTVRVTRQLRTHWDTIRTHFDLQGVSFKHVVESPETQVNTWKAELRRFKAREAGRRYRQWHAKLFTQKAQPSRTLYRWLRSLPPVQHMAIRESDAVFLGPASFFQKTREYWARVMCNDLDGHISAQLFVSDTIHRQEPCLMIEKF